MIVTMLIKHNDTTRAIITVIYEWCNDKINEAWHSRDCSVTLAIESVESDQRFVVTRTTTGCPKKKYTQLWYRIIQAHYIGPECYWYHFLQNIFLHNILVKFQRIIMITLWDIAFKPKAPVFKVAHYWIIDNRSQLMHPSNVWYFQIF